ncbi:MAG TPA: hypothetical protein VFM12_01140 [Gemmatimonadales bacterium]|jgi:hypothetical protein|nr:hypothetical protein [Gemmatimonadales bacterium]
MFRFSESPFMGVTLLMLLLQTPLAAQAPGPIELRGSIGLGVPVTPSDFRSGWTPGVGAAIDAGYHVSNATSIGVRVEYQHFGKLPALFSDPSGQFRLSHSNQVLWAGWLDAAHAVPLDPAFRGRIHGGLGLVDFGAAARSLAFELGAGLDVPLSPRFSAMLDITFAHTLVDDLSDDYPLVSPYSYLPARIGVSWR